MIFLVFIFGALAMYALNFLIRSRRQVPKYRAYWDEVCRNPSAGGLVVTALGDSLMQGIGADVPEEGLFGRIVSYIHQETDQPVTAVNLSVVGAKIRDVIRVQLPQIRESDLVVVSVGSNDSTKMTNLNDFRDDLELLMKQLPLQKTIVADIGFVGNRAPYQRVIDEIRQMYGVKAATLEHSGFKSASLRDKYRFMAKDFFHPSSFGYTYWFQAFQPALKELIDDIQSKK